jgi:hypothetical protein
MLSAQESAASACISELSAGKPEFLQDGTRAIDTTIGLSILPNKADDAIDLLRCGMNLSVRAQTLS